MHHPAAWGGDGAGAVPGWDVARARLGAAGV